MATVDQVWMGLQSQLVTALTGILPAQNVVIDWPPLNAIQAVATNQLPGIVSVFDLGGTKNATVNIILNPALPANYGNPGGLLTPSAVYLPAGTDITIAGSGIPIVNDAFCLTLAWGNYNVNQLFANYTASGSDTLTTAMEGFLAQINTLEGISATLLDNVVTVTNNNDVGYILWTEVVNVGTLTLEKYRWDREVQITTWAATPKQRSAIGNPIELLLTNLEAQYGIQLADQSWMRILVCEDIVWRDSQNEDVYRRDFRIMCNYPVLSTIPAWVIETTQQTLQGGYGPLN